MEIRSQAGAFEVRQEGDRMTIEGVAAPFNEDADLGSFRERIEPGAFERSISSGQDVRVLAHHDPSQLLARRANESLTLWETPGGLSFRATLPATTLGADVREQVSTRLLDSMSIGFLPWDEWVEMEGGEPVRILSSIDLREISLVANPAYGGTSVSGRSVDAAVEQRLRHEVARLRIPWRRNLAERRMSLIA